MSTSLRGFMYIVIAVIFWGSSASLAKYLFTTRFDTLIITQTRSSLSFVLLAIFFLFKKRQVFRVKKNDMLLFFLVGIIGVAATNFTYYYTVQHTTVATAILVQYTSSVFVMFYVVMISKEESWNRMKIVALILALAGCYFAISGGKIEQIQLHGWSLLSGPASAVCYAFMIVASKYLSRRYASETILLYSFGIATIFWLCINTPMDIYSQGYSLYDWGVLWFFAVASILLPYSFFIASMKMLDASTIGIVSILEPIVAIIVAFLALGEQLNSVQIIGAVSVIAASVMLQFKK
jgi:drug/metabolite transporter (DMT)-like permease